MRRIRAFHHPALEEIAAKRMVGDAKSLVERERIPM